MKTVFIVGAGASKELGFPTGEELKKQIATLLSLRYNDWGDYEGGDRLIWQCLTRDVSKKEQNLNACREISGAMPLAPSIDNYLHTHGSNPSIQSVGKLAISRIIIQKESESSIRFNSKKDGTKLDFSSAQESWLHAMFRLLAEGRTLSNFSESLSQVVFANFNYDRSIEHFMHNAVRTYFGVDADEATDLLSASLRVHHAYGSVGCLPWQQNEGTSVDYGTSVEYGGEVNFLTLADVSKEIKTFTEGESGQRAVIQDALADAVNVVFLGFGYHRTNMKYIAKERSRPAVSSFATTYGLSDYLQEQVSAQIRALLKAPSRVGHHLSASKARKFFDEFGTSLIGS